MVEIVSYLQNMKDNGVVKRAVINLKWSCRRFRIFVDTCEKRNLKGCIEPIENQGIIYYNQKVQFNNCSSGQGACYGKIPDRR